MNGEVDLDMGFGIEVHDSSELFKALTRKSSEEREKDFVVWQAVERMELNTVHMHAVLLIDQGEYDCKQIFMGAGREDAITTYNEIALLSRFSVGGIWRVGPHARILFVVW